MNKILLVLTFLLTIHFPTLQAQTTDTTSYWRVMTKDGNQFAGQLIGNDGYRLQLRTSELGVLYIPREDVDYMEPVGNPDATFVEAIRTEPQPHHYILTYSSYPLRKGDIILTNVFLLFNQVDIGISDQFTLSGGLVPYFLFGGELTPVWIRPKLSFPTSHPKLHLGIQSTIGLSLSSHAASSSLITNALGTLTAGWPHKNITLGLGFSYINDGVGTSVPSLLLAGKLSVNRKTNLMSENLLILTGNEVTGLVSIIGQTYLKWLSIEYGFYGLLFKDAVFFTNSKLLPIPWLSLRIPLHAGGWQR